MVDSITTAQGDAGSQEESKTADKANAKNSQERDLKSNNNDDNNEKDKSESNNDNPDATDKEEQPVQQMLQQKRDTAEDEDLHGDQKRSKREWLAYRGARHTRVGADFQVATLPTPTTTTASPPSSPKTDN